MESKKDSEIGICHECSTKNMDSSQKNVFHCDLCKKCFCEEHLRPKFPYFVDWDTVFDIQGNPEIKALFHTEHKREGGHPDFVYLRNIIEKCAIEEEQRNRLIETALDRMMETAHSRPVKSIVPAWVKSEVEEIIWTLEKSGNISPEEAIRLREQDRRASAVITCDNKFNHHFRIPAGIYSIDKYYERLNKARTLAEVDPIIADYKKHLKKEKKRGEKNQTKNHWWQ